MDLDTMPGIVEKTGYIRSQLSGEPNDRHLYYSVGRVLYFNHVKVELAQCRRYRSRIINGVSKGASL